MGSSIRNAAPQNVGIFNMLSHCHMLQRWSTGRHCSKCKELLLRLKVWVIVPLAEIVSLLNLLGMHIYTYMPLYTYTEKENIVVVQ